MGFGSNQNPNTKIQRNPKTQSMLFLSIRLNILFYCCNLNENLILRKKKNIFSTQLTFKIMKINLKSV